MSIIKVTLKKKPFYRNHSTKTLSNDISTSSTSDTCDHHMDTFCSSCQKKEQDILRLVLIEQLSISLFRIIIKDGRRTSEQLMNVRYLKILCESTFYESFDSIDSDTWPVPESQREFLDTFMSRFADFLEIDTNSAMKSIVNILSSSRETLFDFDLPFLTEKSQKKLKEILDNINRVFWYPKSSPKNSTVGTNFDFFGFVEPGCVVPCYTSPYEEDFVDKENYLSCTHAIENSRYLIRWCISDRSVSSDCCLKVLKMLKKMGIVANDNFVPLQNHKFIFQGHLVHVPRGVSNSKDGAERK